MPNARKRKPDQTSLTSWILHTKVEDGEIEDIFENGIPVKAPKSETDEVPALRRPKTSANSLPENEIWNFDEDDGTKPSIDLEKQEAELMRQLQKRRRIV